MACKSCGGQPKQTKGKTVKKITEVPPGYPMVMARYIGPSGKHGVTGLATKKFYGRKKKGDRFMVHIADVEAHKEMFEILATPDSSAISLPKTPETIRQAPPPPPTPPQAPVVEKKEEEEEKPKKTRKKRTTRKRRTRKKKTEVKEE
jgi:hypothetical protein